MRAGDEQSAGRATHQRFDQSCARWAEGLRLAERRVVAQPESSRAWEELADAARQIEADSVLAGEMGLAYLATKLDGAVTEAVAAGLPPAETALFEVRHLMQLFDEEYATLETRWKC